MMRKLWFATVLLAAACAAPQRGGAQQIDWRAVDQALGRTGQMQPGDVYRFSMPRSDLNVTTRGVTIRPALSLGSWIAFKASGPNSAVAMGDLVLTEAEFNRVIARLQQGGVGQTAIHKHLPEHSPGLWWTHIHAHGDPVAIARTVRDALALTGTPPQPAQPPAAAPIDLDTAAVGTALGVAGRVNGGVYQVGVPRRETIRAMGIEVPPAMGMATVINFQPTGGGRAAINGDFVMIASEVDAVVKALADAAIEVVSLHNHLTDEQPRLMFMHFWANDDAVKLARGLRTALERTNSVR
jgi:hypothetical protein